MRPGQINVSDLPMPVILRPSAAISDEELMRFSEQNKPFQIERNKNGELIVKTPVGGIGGTQEFYVASMLFAWIERDGRGIGFGPNTGFALHDGSCVSPDAAWLSRKRWDALTAEQQAGYPPVCPEFIVEIRSRTDPRRLIETKMQLWMENGASLAWLLDPIDGAVTIYRPARVPETLVRPEVVRGEGPVEGWELPCGRLWSGDPAGR